VNIGSRADALERIAVEPVGRWTTDQFHDVAVCGEVSSCRGSPRGPEARSTVAWSGSDGRPLRILLFCVSAT
jgi:hypothetical protein